jgi:hypothetical protein
LRPGICCYTRFKTFTCTQTMFFVFQVLCPSLFLASVHLNKKDSQEMAWAKVALKATNPKQALNGPKRKTFLNRESINTSHHQNSDHENLRIVFTHKTLLITKSI